MTTETSEEKLQYALFQINESLPDDEACFEWLLVTDEFYTDERWLNCIVTHACKFVSIKIVKMLLDVLSMFQEFDITNAGLHSDIYTTVRKVGHVAY